MKVPHAMPYGMSNKKVFEALVKHYRNLMDQKIGPPTKEALAERERLEKVDNDKNLSNS